MLNFFRAIKRYIDIERLESLERGLQKAPGERAKLKKKQEKRARNYETLRKRYMVPEAGRKVLLGGHSQKTEG